MNRTLDKTYLEGAANTGNVVEQETPATRTAVALIILASMERVFVFFVAQLGFLC